MCDGYSQKWNYEMVSKLIHLRGRTYAHLFEGKNCNYIEAWRKILKGFDKHFTYEQVKKKWYNLVSKYKRLNALQEEEGLDAAAKWPHYNSIHLIMTGQFNESSSNSYDEESDEPLSKQIKIEIDIGNSNSFDNDHSPGPAVYYDSKVTPEPIIVQPESHPQIGTIRCSSFAYNPDYEDSQPANPAPNIMNLPQLNGVSITATTNGPRSNVPKMPALTLIKRASGSFTSKNGENDIDDDVKLVHDDSEQHTANERYRNFSNFIYSELLAMSAENAEKLMKDITKSYCNIKYQ